MLNNTRNAGSSLAHWCFVSDKESKPCYQSTYNTIIIVLNLGGNKRKPLPTNTFKKIKNKPYSEKDHFLKPKIWVKYARIKIDSNLGFYKMGKF